MFEIQPIPVQHNDSLLCGIYCLYVAQGIYSSNSVTPSFATEEDILNFGARKFNMSKSNLNYLKN